LKSGLKHELRTPLNHIIGYCELLLEEGEERGLGAAAADLQRIHGAGKRLLNVVNDLFDADKGGSLRADRSLVHHEVRTPLNQIIGYIEMLEEEMETSGRPALLADLRKIDAAARGLLKLVVEHLLNEGDTAELPRHSCAATRPPRRSRAGLSPARSCWSTMIPRTATCSPGGWRVLATPSPPPRTDGRPSRSSARRHLI